MAKGKMGRRQVGVYCAYCGAEWSAGEVRGHQVKCREERGGVPVWGVGSVGVGEGECVAGEGVGVVGGGVKKEGSGKARGSGVGVKKEVVYEAFEE